MQWKSHDISIHQHGTIQKHTIHKNIQYKQTFALRLRDVLARLFGPIFVEGEKRAIAPWRWQHFKRGGKRMPVATRSSVCFALNTVPINAL